MDKIAFTLFGSEAKEVSKNVGVGWKNSEVIFETKVKVKYCSAEGRTKVVVTVNLEE